MLKFHYFFEDGEKKINIIEFTFGLNIQYLTDLQLFLVILKFRPST